MEETNNFLEEKIKKIENLNKTAQRIRIIEPLYGDIDFSILAEYGFSTIKDITLSKGEITSITGLPKILMSLSCVDNLLTELIDLPRGLRNIDIAHNCHNAVPIEVMKKPEFERFKINKNKVPKGQYIFKY